MIIESKYDLLETINKMQNNTCTYEQYKPYLHLDGSMLPRYVGTVTEEDFHLQKKMGTKQLLISGRVYEENGKTYIMFWPTPNINHILLLILCAVFTVYCVIKWEWRTMLIELAVFGILSLVEFKRFREDYVEFQDFIKEILQ